MKSRATYRRFAQYYDLYVGDFAADLPLYKSLCESARRILEIGCGTGRVLRALLQAGFSVTRIDISDEMLDVAKAKLSEYLQDGTLRLVKHDVRESPFGEEYDRVLVTWFTFNYLLTESDQNEFVLNARESLAPNGLLVMDLFYPQPLAEPNEANRWKESTVESGGRHVALKQRRKMVGQIEERTQIYTEGEHRDEIITERRFVNKQELAAMLEQAGFSNIRVTDRYDDSGLHTLTDGERTDSRFVCVAAKPA